MMLYFDNYITNTPLIPNFYSDLEKIRASCPAYSTRDKFDITLYTLASYAEYPWTKVIIVYSLEDESKKEKFEKFVREIFPKEKLILIYGRSSTQKEYQEKLKILNEIKDDWVFYAGNNDHPFMCSNFEVLKSCLKKAEEYSKKAKLVSILYSHFSEGYNLAREGVAIHDLHYPTSRLIEEDKNCIVVNFPHGWNTAIQIVNKNLINHWVSSKELSGTFRKIEEMEPYVKTENQIMIAPKKLSVNILMDIVI